MTHDEMAEAIATHIKNGREEATGYWVIRRLALSQSLRKYGLRLEGA